ncbi:hypothetical protein ACFX2I_034633 [Malus domestica]
MSPATNPGPGFGLSSSPNQLPQTKTPNEQSKKQPRNGLSTGVIIAIVIVICVAMLVVVSFLMVHYCARDRCGSRSMAGSESGKRRSGSSYEADQKRVYTNSGGGGDSDGTNATDRSKLFLRPEEAPGDCVQGGAGVHKGLLLQIFRLSSSATSSSSSSSAFVPLPTLDWIGLDWIGLFVFSWDSHKRISQFLGFSDEKVRDFLIWGSGFLH